MGLNEELKMDVPPPREYRPLGAASCPNALILPSSTAVTSMSPLAVAGSGPGSRSAGWAGTSRPGPVDPRGQRGEPGPHRPRGFGVILPTLASKSHLATCGLGFPDSVGLQFPQLEDG